MNLHVGHRETYEKDGYTFTIEVEDSYSSLKDYETVVSIEYDRTTETPHRIDSQYILVVDEDAAKEEGLEQEHIDARLKRAKEYYLDQWTYVALVLTVSRAGHIAQDSICGIESDCGKEYYESTKKDLESEALYNFHKTLPVKIKELSRDLEELKGLNDAQV